MCTAVTLKTRDFYFGRSLDYEHSYGEQVTITPRNYPFRFRHKGTIESHYAIIGMAYVSESYPLYFDATNEAGLSIAGLNFPGNAVYFPKTDTKQNVAPFELIPLILGQCNTISEATALLDKINILVNGVCRALVPFRFLAF